ncbi:MAG TPA: bifunctional adenosylcobinamide kinase/adenosylcobinamide-phosphate guanylyltransferase [Blastocatellia bacterium]|jgi:adenosyl cobinamide kinase/adenosyl cobinamide phosphate guanylyltransferase
MSKALSMDERLILLLGGARAGKSSCALRLAAERQQLSGSKACFIATAQALDDEMSARIARHRAERPPHWQTIEEPYQLDDALRQTTGAGVVVVDCLTLFVSNWLLQCEDESRCEKAVRQITERFLKLAQSQGQMIICVSNEVGLGVVPETRLGRVFRDLIGRVNQDFSQAADEVYLLVAGLPLRLKPVEGKPPFF